MSSLTWLKHRAIVALKGRDTFKYLQGVTTNNLAEPSSQFTAFLNPQGRLLYDAFIYRTAESECLVEVDASKIDEFMAHLKRYKLRSKFDMRRLHEDELKVYSVYNLAQATSPVSIQDGTVHQIDNRSPSFGHRILSPSVPLDIPESPLAAYTQFRYVHGIAEGHEELIQEKALPQESNIDYMHGLDFKKGCYIGQELTVRTYHTGVVRKRIVPIRIFDESDSAPVDVHAGLTSMTLDPEKWVPTDRCDVIPQSEPGVKARPSGRVLAAIGNVGIALHRLENMDPGTIVRDGKLVNIMPYRPEHWLQ